MVSSTASLRILAIDIGGSHIKATVLDEKGKLQQEYIKAATPSPPDPKNILHTIKELTAGLTGFDYISAGFPGYVRKGVVFTAPNLGTPSWAGVDFRKLLERSLDKPVQLVNDADMQGLGVVKGKGLELVVTLGTGFGTALLSDGILLPHLELAHHPITNTKDYDQYIGDGVLLKIGEEKWNKRMAKVLSILKTVFNYDTLYIGGGNARKLTLPLDKNIKLITNKDGIRGGARLWTGISAVQQLQHTNSI